jgi:hypothetical protein
VDLSDARWFAVDLHVPDRRFGVLQIGDDVVDRASFLDTRLPAPLASAAPLAVAEAAKARLPRAPVGWLMHTSFCASTLLARALHVPPHAVALKEPLVLRRLSDAHKSGWSLDGLVAPTVALLARPWHAGGAVVVKPTHVALNVAPQLMTATPGRRGVVVTSSLDDFLISNLKKDAETQAKIPTLVERALKAAPGFRGKLAAAALAPPDPVCAAGVQWAAQRELVCDAITTVGAARLRVLDMDELLRDVPAATVAVARWLELGIPDDALARHAAAAATHNAKALEVGYGPEQRAREAAMVTSHFRGELARGRAWLDAHVLPKMRAAARDTPAAWTSA